MRGFKQKLGISLLRFSLSPFFGECRGLTRKQSLVEMVAGSDLKKIRGQGQYLRNWLAGKEARATAALIWVGRARIKEDNNGFTD